MKYLLPILFLGLLISCNTQKIPDGAKVVDDFEKSKYLGDWYEIARFDFYFERDLTNTMAQYSLNRDGSIKVINSGYDTIKNKWKKSEGVAKFRGSDNKGSLKVSFFGPFYGGYNVLSIDDDYNYALVAGKNTDYLWILSRQKAIPEDIKEKYINMAKDLGFDTTKLLWPAHDMERPIEF